jgi:adenylate cyclase
VRHLRLATGLILFGYLSTHLANHALGLISLAAMEDGREWFLDVWRSPLGTAALYASLGIHFLLALWSLYRRRTLRMPAWETLQLLLGLAIPPLLLAHIIGTRIALEWFEETDSYAKVLAAMWLLHPASGARQAVALVVAWIHGCIGLHLWLRLRSWYPRVRPLLFAAALLLPVLALLGFAQGAREVARGATKPRAADARTGAALARLADGALLGFAGSLGLVLLARAGRRAYERRSGAIRLTYPEDRVIIVPRGLTVLEVSRLARIPHASVCGGRGRCSTCRIRIVQGLEALPPASPEELRVLGRVGAPPNVRLACQLRPTRDLSLVPLLPANATAKDGFARPAAWHGQEAEIAVLFADLRGFTRLSERKLPYDLVFFLNRYFEAVGGAILRAGGIPNQFTGDGVMALFGVHAGPREGCRQALAAARELVNSVATLSRSLAGELAAPLRIGIGIHAGPAVVGRMGFGEAAYLTAVGDTVHVASRLQDLTKEYQCHLVISEQVAARADLDISSFPRREITVRNRAEPLVIRVIDSVLELPLSLPSPPPVSPPPDSGERLSR